LFILEVKNEQEQRERIIDFCNPVEAHVDWMNQFTWIESECEKGGE
jgi:hypothetical protein